MGNIIMTHGQLFGGIFGFGLAAQWAGIENVWYNEIEHYPCEVVRDRIADGSIIDNVNIYEQDIRTIGKHNLLPVDIISAGVPCQPASIAGNRKGTKDDRWLWDETLRVVSELKPTYVICENPPGILTLENGKPFQQILFALGNEGYNVELYNIPACSTGAWHRRERIWIIAYSNEINSKQGSCRKQQGKHFDGENTFISDSYTQGLEIKQCEQKNDETKFKTIERNNIGGEHWAVEPRVDRMVHGLPNRVDRIKGLGNAIVPQVAYEIFKAITSNYGNRAQY